MMVSFWGINALADCIEDPVNYWTLDQETPPFTNEILDGVAGTCDAGTCPDVDNDGQVGLAQQFDGVGTGITIADQGASVFDIETDGSFSISAWFRRDTGYPTRNEVLVGRYAEGESHVWIGINPSGQATFRLWDSTAFTLSLIQQETYGRVIGTSTVADGGWHHIVGVRDGANGLNLLYVDGVLEGSSEESYTGTFTATNAPTELGSLTNDYYFSGSLDEVAVFDIALSGDVVGTIFDAGYDFIALCTDNISPAITSTPVTTAEVGVEYTYNPTAEDVDNDTLEWSLTNAPDGMTIDSATGAISWTPTEASSQSVDIYLSVTDGLASDQQEFTITVSGASGTDTSTDTSVDDGSSDDSGGSSSGGGGGCFISTGAKANYRFLMEVAGALAFLVMLLPLGFRKNK